VLVSSLNRATNTAQVLIVDTVTGATSVFDDVIGTTTAPAGCTALAPRSRWAGLTSSAPGACTASTRDAARAGRRRRGRLARRGASGRRGTPIAVTSLASIPVLLVHGGAGRRATTSGDDVEAQRRAGLAVAIDAGWRALADGAQAACVAAVCALEDSPYFNAGTGSELAADGGVWCDASLMSGDGGAGAVAAVQGIRNPILAAQALAADARPPMLWTGRSPQLATRYGLELVDPAAMITERQSRRLLERRARAAERAAAGGGTVGAVCLDASGALAAATSTGGYCGKPLSRIGDSAIVGAGTWAHPLTCAISATGDGEAFMRALFAHEVHARMLHAGEDLPAAAAAALAAVGEAGGLGGAICVDIRGAIAMPISSDVMYRAWRRADGATQTAVDAQDRGASSGSH
jgi:beta-aspartyl-peptidase (threonine type)